MSFYIILRGPAGSGKTTVANKLKEIYNAHYISIDKIKHEKKLKHSEKEKLEANKYVIEEALKYLEDGMNVIIDEVLYYEKQIEELENMPYKHFIFSLNATLESCLERNKKRRLSGKRKISDEDVRLVYNLSSRISKGIQINTNRTIEETIKEIIKKLSS